MTILNFTLKILLSIVLGFLIGLERQLTGHPAGIRINVLISMGTCFFTLFPLISGSDQVFRVGASIISGVGFLCSGVIFKENGSVKGMNTAATLWCTAAIGILTGLDSFTLPVIASIILVVSNLLLRPLARKISPLKCMDEEIREYRISVTCLEEAEMEIRQLLLSSIASKHLYLTSLESGDAIGDKVEVVASYSLVNRPNNKALEEIVSKALKEKKVISAGWELI